MSANLYDAHRQWANRPPDERFRSLDSLYEFLDGRRQASSERTEDLSRLNLVATDKGSLAFDGEDLKARLSNWSFSQLCYSVDAPAKYLRRLPAELVQQCLSLGMTKTGRTCKLLIRDTGQSNRPDDSRYAAAITSQSYGRIWDADVLAEVVRAIRGTEWHPPSGENGNDREPNGLYASDRDMFVFLVNEDSPVEIGEARLRQGFFCWNSETGAASFGLKTFLYNTACANCIVWDVHDVKEFRFPHRHNAEEYFRNTAMPVLRSFVQRRTESGLIRRTVDHAMRTKLADGLDDLLEWAKEKPFSQHELQQAWAIGEENGERANTVWGLVQGLTAHAQTMNHINRRVYLERRAGRLLKQVA